MVMGDFASMASVLNEEELRCNPDQLCSPAVHLLVLILTENLEDARMLHKRLPDPQKNDAQVQKVVALLQALWHKEYEETFKVLQQTQWQDDLRPLIHVVEQRFRAKMAALVSKAYSQIRIQKGSALVGLPAEQLIQAAPTFGWTWNPNNNTFTVQKKPQTGALPSNHAQIQRLTQYVAHLED